MRISIRTVLSLAAVGAVLVAGPALAESADWIAPASEGITSLKDSIITLAGPILAVAIVIFAAWAGLTQRINWQVLITLVVVAFLMGVGPTAMTWMLDAFKAS